MFELPPSAWLWLAAAFVGGPLLVARFIYTGTGEQQ